MADARQIRRWRVLGIVFVAAWTVFRLVAGFVEGRIAARIEAMASRLGLRIHYDELRVGLFPPFRLTGVVVEKPGQATVWIDVATAWPQFHGPLGFGLLARASMGGIRLTLPAGVEASMNPTVWEVDPQRSITLVEPVQGLMLTATTSARGQTFDAVASHLSMDAFGSFSVEGDASRELGVVDGMAHAEGDPRKDFQGTWRFSAFGGESGGSFIVVPSEPDAKVQFQASMKRLDFAHILRSLGVDTKNTPNALGSLSGTISVGGRLHDPGSLDVIQRIDFKRPEKTPPEVARLRGPFVHEVTTNTGARKTIAVTPESSDFIAIEEVPPLFIRTLLIAEDAAFFGHPGIDLTELPRAIATNIARGNSVRGASTITQQLAKNLFLSREKSLQRKLRELSYSFLLESTLGKQRILEIYLNIIEWGPGLYGLRPAARHYFDKDPAALTPREIACLVSLIPGPVMYQRSIAGGEVRKGFDALINNLLVKLRSVDAISEDEFQQALEETLVFRGQPPPVDGAWEPAADR